MFVVYFLCVKYNYRLNKLFYFVVETFFSCFLLHSDNHNNTCKDFTFANNKAFPKDTINYFSGVVGVMCVHIMKNQWKRYYYDRISSWGGRVGVLWKENSFRQKLVAKYSYWQARKKRSIFLNRILLSLKSKIQENKPFFLLVSNNLLQTNVVETVLLPLNPASPGAFLWLWCTYSVSMLLYYIHTTNSHRFL